MNDVKQEVRQFYDQVGWKLLGDEIYQNARYEDLRPVAREYIHNCHLRVARHLKSQGVYLLDAGSGPVQYPEYLEYGRLYRYRVCADISITALREARKRVGEKGLYVVADIANLPFKPESFDGLVSLHTIHHLPESEHLRAFVELERMLAPGSTAVVVNGWDHSALMNLANPLIRFANRLRNAGDKIHRSDYRAPGDTRATLLPSPSLQGGEQGAVSPPSPQGWNQGADSPPSPQGWNQGEDSPPSLQGGGREVGSSTPSWRGDPSRSKKAHKLETGKGTHTEKHDAAWVKSVVAAGLKSSQVEVRVWRSVTVRFTRALIHPRLGGRYWLRLIFWLEERFPHFTGEKGKYPLIIMKKA